MKVCDLIEILESFPAHYEVKHLELTCGYAIEIFDEDVKRNDEEEIIVIG